VAYTTEWVALLISVAIATSFFTIPSRIGRRRVFVMVSVVSLAATAYASIKAVAQSEVFFSAAGLPISLLLLGGLGFGALTMNHAFHARELRRWVCVPGCWIFAVTIVFSLAYTFYIWPLSSWELSGVRDALDLGVLTIVPIVLIAGFITSGISGLNIRMFQVFLPIIVVLLFCSLIVTFNLISDVNAAGFFQNAVDSRDVSTEGLFPDTGRPGDSSAADEKILEKWRQLAVGRLGSPGRLQLKLVEVVLFDATWPLFWVIGFFYLNALAHARNLVRGSFIDKLAKAAVVLVIANFLYSCPEYHAFRRMVPTLAEVIDLSAAVLDLSFLASLLVVAIVPRMLVRRA
jgi:hypothetical protein